jgi:hypothetical protein
MYHLNQLAVLKCELPGQLMPAPAGFSDKALEITLHIEQALYEATTLLNAVSLADSRDHAVISAHLFSELDPAQVELSYGSDCRAK